MNFLEKYGKVIAMSLCGVSFLPAVSIVKAQENTPGWHGKKYVNTDQKVARGWQEVQGDKYYFDESDGEMDEQATKEGTTASVSAAAAAAIEKEVTETVSQTVEEEAARVQEAAPEETADALDEVQPADKGDQPVENTIDNSTEENEAVSQTQPAEEIQQPVQNEVQPEGRPEEQPAPEQPVVEEERPAQSEQPVVEEEQPAPEVQAPAVEEQPVAEEEQPVQTVQPEVEQPVQDIQPEPEQPAAPEPEEQPVVEEPAVEVPAEPEPAPQEPVQPEQPVGGQYSALNQAIVNSALKLVDTTNGLQCTEVVQMALAGAGVSDAMTLWPDEYAAMYGYYTDNPQAGNLIYYNNGGRGTDHIAVYIGDGQAVHGNFYTDGESKTVIFRSDLPNASAPQYIQVQR